MNPGTSKHTIISKGVAFCAGICLICCFYSSKALNINHRNKTLIHFSKSVNGKINVEVITDQPKKVALYLFSANGELIKKLDTNTKQVNEVSGINEGQYLYQCFENDTQLKSGKLMVKSNNIRYN